jgi:hypothetical protein
MPSFDLTSIAARAAGGAFAAVARRRRARPVHPHGPVFAATAAVTPRGAALLGLAGPAEVGAILRLSRSFDVVSGMPDLLGVAVRLCEVRGAGAHQDLLLVSSPGPPLGPLVMPTRHYTHRWYTSLLPYRAAGGPALVMARSRAGAQAGRGDALEAAQAAAQAGALEFDVGVASLAGRSFEPLARVCARDILDGDRGGRVAFDPIVHSGPRLHQSAGPLDAIRERSYRDSRMARPATTS